MIKMGYQFNGQLNWYLSIINVYTQFMHSFRNYITRTSQLLSFKVCSDLQMLNA